MKLADANDATMKLANANDPRLLAFKLDHMAELATVLGEAAPEGHRLEDSLPAEVISGELALDGYSGLVTFCVGSDEDEKKKMRQELEDKGVDIHSHFVYRFSHPLKGQKDLLVFRAAPRRLNPDPHPKFTVQIQADCRKLVHVLEQMYLHYCDQCHQQNTEVRGRRAFLRTIIVTRKVKAKGKSRKNAKNNKLLVTLADIMEGKLKLPPVQLRSVVQPSATQAARSQVRDSPRSEESSATQAARSRSQVRDSRSEESPVTQAARSQVRDSPLEESSDDLSLRLQALSARVAGGRLLTESLARSVEGLAATTETLTATTESLTATVQHHEDRLNAQDEREEDRDAFLNDLQLQLDEHVEREDEREERMQLQLDELARAIRD